MKGTKRHAEIIREESREFLEGKLKLKLNMDKTHITHVDDGFVFLGHRVIRKRGPHGSMRPVTTIPKIKCRGFADKITKTLSGNYSENKIDLVKSLNYKITGWTNFYQYTDYTAKVYGKLDQIVFWRLAHWLGVKYKSSIKQCASTGIRRPGTAQTKTWMVEGFNNYGYFERIFLKRFVSSRKNQFRWRNPESNPYLQRLEKRQTVTSHYKQVAIALSHS